MSLLILELRILGCKGEVKIPRKIMVPRNLLLLIQRRRMRDKVTARIILHKTTNQLRMEMILRKAAIQ